jgi:protocatechuate 3,4-dioxygenase beta subunit
MNPTRASRRPQRFHIPVNRRRFFQSMAIASAGFTLPGYLAEALTLSPIVTQGPYYPLAQNIPLDKDNDLVQLNDNLTSAAGIVTYISGRVLDSSGNPVRGALIELWHADREGDYVYSNSATRNAAGDANFAGFGQYLTGADWRYLFRTIRAGLYVGRTRHYHWGVTLPGRTTRSTTQTGWNETTYDLNGNLWATQNSNDNVFSTVSNAEQRASMLLNFSAVPGTSTGEVQSSWDFVSQFTPTYPSYPNGGALVIAGTPVAGPTNSTRFRISVPTYSGYTYEIYGNPTFGDLSWKALPFALTQNGSIATNKFTATSDGTLQFYTTTAPDKGFY